MGNPEAPRTQSVVDDNRPFRSLTGFERNGDVTSTEIASKSLLKQLFPQIQHSVLGLECGCERSSLAPSRPLLRVLRLLTNDPGDRRNWTLLDAGLGVYVLLLRRSNKVRAFFLRFHMQVREGSVAHGVEGRMRSRQVCRWQSASR